MGTFEYLIITRVIRPFSCPDYIVAGTSQFVGGFLTSLTDIIIAK